MKLQVISYRYDQHWGSTLDEEGHGSHTTGQLPLNSKLSTLNPES